MPDHPPATAPQAPASAQPTVAELTAQAQALGQAGQHQQGHEVLLGTLRALAQAGLPPDHPAVREVGRQAWKLAPFWWHTWGNAHLSLRRTRSDDAAFFKACFANPDWARRYNRQAPWQGDLGRALHKAGLLPPVDLGQCQWVVCGAGGQPLGLASMSSLDLRNRKAELSLGVVGGAQGRPSVAAMLWMLQVAFVHMGLNRLYTHVYTDNPEAKNNTAHFGFTLEGCLRDHFFLPPGQFHSVWVFGLTRAQWQADTRLHKMARRLIGVDWPGGQAVPPVA